MNNKALGKGFEREIAEKLTNLLRETSHIMQDEKFYRVLGSGMLAGHRHLIDAAVLESYKGDIYGPGDWPFIVECKRRRSNPNFHLVVQKKKHEIFDWIDQVCGDCEGTLKIPLLIMKFIPNMGTYVAMEHSTWKNWQPIMDRTFKPNFVYMFHPTKPVDEDEQRMKLWVIMDWAQFEEMVKEDYDSWLWKKMNKGS